MEHRITMPLRWRDLDDNGHLNQAVYHELLEDVRRGMVGSAAGAFVLARVELNYRREVRLDDSPVEAVARITHVGTKSFTIEQEILVGDTVAADGIAICVAWDAEARAARAITDEERAAMTA
jgi:acyl-CoA thioester hydrolase